MSMAGLRPSYAARSLAPPDVRDGWIPRRIIVAWCLLFLDVAPFYAGGPLHVPSIVGKALTQGALPVAIILILSVNRKVMVRPNVYLSLVAVLVLETVVNLLQPQHLGTYYRTFRLAEFVLALWLLTPWWGRRDLLLVRAHLTALACLLGSVILGLLVFPGSALSGGRLSGVLWPIPPPQVAHYAAVTVGIVVVLWFGGVVRGKIAWRIAAAGVVILVATHTRTALLAMVAGIILAGLSLVVGKPRVRRFFAAAGAVAGTAIIAFSSLLSSWLARGQGTGELATFTGRTGVWGPLVAFPRTHFQELFGFGLSNSSFNGLAIDSNWLSVYQEQGLIGDVISGVILLFLLTAAYLQPRGVKRALALFLITYCLIASFTEDGFTDATPYMLDITVAASMLIPSAS
jgi:hypothetical protein